MKAEVEPPLANTPRGGDFVLLLGLLGPPVIWALRFGAAYVLVPHVCVGGWSWVLHAITLVTLACIGWLLVIARGHWRVGAETMDAGALVVQASRGRFMAFAGVLSSGFFLLVVAAEGLANFFIDPCLQAGIPIA